MKIVLESLLNVSIIEIKEIMFTESNRLFFFSFMSKEIAAEKLVSKFSATSFNRNKTVEETFTDDVERPFLADINGMS